MKKSALSVINYKRKHWLNNFKFFLIKKMRNIINQDKIILFDSLYNSAESIDAKTLYLYLKEKNYNAIYLSNNKVDRKLLKNFWLLCTTKSIITSFSLDDKLTSNIKYIGINYIFIQHGIFMLKQSAIKYYQQMPFDYVLVSNDIEFNLLKKNGWNPNKIIKAGLARWDNLNTKKTNETNSVMVMFTFRNSFMQENNDFIKSLYFLNLCSLLEKLSQAGKQVFLSIHHTMHNSIEEKIKGINKTIQIINKENVSEYVKKSDTLITDYSSISFDFFYQNKNVIFYHIDKNDIHLNKQDMIDAEYFNSQKNLLLPFLVTDNEQSVIQEILTPRLIPENATNKFFYYKNNICKYIENEFNILGLI